MKNVVMCFQAVIRFQKNLILKNSAVILCVLFLVFLATLAYANEDKTVDVNTLATQVKAVAQTVKGMISTVIMVILALGAAYIIYEFVTGSEKARKHLVLFFAGVIIFGLVKALGVF